MLLEALASAIDGTDVKETMRLAAEFNESFGDLVRASVSPESDIAPEEGRSLTRDDEQNHRTDQVNRPMLKENRVEMANSAENGQRPKKCDDAPKQGKKNKLIENMVEIREETDVPRVKRKERDPDPSSDESVVLKSKKKKNKRKARKRKNESLSDPPSDSSSNSDSASSEDDDSDDSDEADKAELCYDVTNFESADLPDLPDKWDKGFRKLRSYVPLSLFKASVIESYHEEDSSKKSKEKSETSKNSLKTLEKQLTYGDFIEMCDLEERYAREIYGLETYADYVVQHKKIVSDLKKTHNCWMIGLRYHLKVRTVIFRRRKLIKTKVKGKTVLKDKVKIPNGLQSQVEQQARHDADRAGDLQFVDNPYAVGGPKFGFDFTTGRQTVSLATPLTKEKGEAQNPNNPSSGYRGNRAGSNKKPYAKKYNYSFNRYQRYPTEQQGG